ncbi:DUF1360 domain-containing protein [Streptomyces cellulosae]|uniref:DUF1360 domain-containing protein n=1 Tax=Streptomyces cellulosae TaxID=1968 RepID=A0ABW6JE83_STRCE
MVRNLPLLVLVGLGSILAAARITRLITADTITQPLRDALSRRAQLRPLNDGTGTARLAPLPWRWSAKLVACHWCASVWVGAATSTGYLAWATGQLPTTWPPSTWFLDLLGLLATSHLVATAADWLDSPPPVKPLHITMTDDR